MAFTLIVFLVALNLILDQYGQGVMRTAVDQGARAGSTQTAVPGEAVAACETKAAEVMHGLLAGPFGRDITISCAVTGDQVRAVASGSLPGWLRIIPADTLHVIGTAHLERNPTPTS
jgi:hypothetical protein